MMATEDEETSVNFAAITNRATYVGFDVIVRPSWVAAGCRRSCKVETEDARSAGKSGGAAGMVPGVAIGAGGGDGGGRLGAAGRVTAARGQGMRRMRSSRAGARCRSPGAPAARREADRGRRVLTEGNAGGPASTGVPVM